MKKFLFWGIVAVIIAFALLTKNPSLLIFNFIIGGIVPGFNISLGFLPSVGLVFILLWFLRKITKNIHRQMIDRAANLNQVENAAKDFTAVNSVDVKKISSAIVAPERH